MYILHEEIASVMIKNDFDRVDINKKSSCFEIMKIFKNFMLAFKCKNFTSIVFTSDSTMSSIYNVRNDILKTVNSVNNVKDNVIIERSNSQRNAILKTPSIYNTKPLHDSKFYVCNKLKINLKKCTAINSMNKTKT